MKHQIKTVVVFQMRTHFYAAASLTSFIIYHLFQIVGIITRHNLTHEFLVAKLRQHYITV